MSDKKTSELKKQISIYVPLSDWRMLRLEAARRKKPITNIVSEMIEPGLDEMRKANQ